MILSIIQPLFIVYLPCTTSCSRFADYNSENKEQNLCPYEAYVREQGNRL